MSVENWRSQLKALTPNFVFGLTKLDVCCLAIQCPNLEVLV